MDSKEIIIETPLAYDELINKLKSVTISDFDRLHQSHPANYYGEISSHTFNIKNICYTPMSNAPSIQGEIMEGTSNTVLKINIDTTSPFKLIRKIYYSILIPIGMLVLLLSISVLRGTEFQLQGILFSTVFIACAFIVVAIEKSSLLNIKEKEIKTFVSNVNGHIISSYGASTEYKKAV